MVDRTLACAEKIKEFFDRDDRFISDLVFMIVVGDIGKAGPVPGDQSSSAKVVSRIYNQAIFHGAHQTWLKSCDPNTFPAELDQAMVRAVFHRGTIITGVKNDDEAKQRAIDTAVNIAHTEIQILNLYSD